MNQLPDDLFREKLERLQKPVPATAWERIAAAQNKKENSRLWLKIAASLLLLALVIYAQWPDAPANQKVSELLSEETTVKPDNTLPPIREYSEANNTDTNEPSAKKKESPPAPVDEQRQLKKVMASETRNNLESATLSAQVIDEELPEVSDTTMLEPSYVQTSETITMVFTAKEVDGYLEKKEISKATSDPKKPSTWKKLLKKANDLTNNQDPFGELRQKKNEILALNFRNDKQRGQNKQ